VGGILEVYRKWSKKTEVSKELVEETKSGENWYGFVRVSTDLQDIGKQEDTVKNWFRREGIREYEIVVEG